MVVYIKEGRMSGAAARTGNLRKRRRTIKKIIKNRTIGLAKNLKKLTDY